MHKTTNLLALTSMAAVLAGCPGSSEGAATDGDTETTATSSATMSGASAPADTSDPAGTSGVASSTTGSETTAAQPAGSSSGVPVDCNDDELSEMYTRYVEPFVSGAVRQSCSGCHMTGVDMSIYARDTPCATMACMVGQGVVDLDSPAQSELLSMIEMGDPDSSVFDVSEEHKAMLEWIEWSAKCHDDVCGETPAACEGGADSPSSGVDPIGDCSEEDLAVVFWDTILADRGRCLACHSDWGYQEGTFGACGDDDDCNGPQICIDSLCRAPGPLLAPHFFEGVDGPLDFENPQHRELGTNSMYNIVALGLIDVDNPLASWMLTKPLLDGFDPDAVYANGIAIESPPPQAVGILHGGTSKFNFGCHEPPCLESGVIDCRTEQSCPGDVPCADGLACVDGFCRMPGSVCDETYTKYVEFIEYFASCKQ